VQHVVHLRYVWRLAILVRVAPFFSKGLRVFAPALEAGPVPGGERGWFVKKEQLGVRTTPNLASAAFKVEQAADPLSRCPTTRRQRLCVRVKAPAAVPHEQSTGRKGA
jgi:hypothetical protein